MTVGDRVDLLVNSKDNYIEIRSKVSSQFIEMMKFMFSEKYELIKEKEKEYETFLNIINNL